MSMDRCNGRDYKTLANWYDDAAAIWFGAAEHCQRRADAVSSTTASEWLELMRGCLLRALHYARLAKQAERN